MKRLLLIFLLLAVAAVGQSAFGQTAREKKQMHLVEGEISRLESEIRALEKEEARQKSQKKFEIRRQLRELEVRADPRRAKSEEDMLLARAETNRLWLQIDSLDAINESSFEISFKRKELSRYQDKRQAMISRWTAPNNTIPREMRVVTKNRYLRANEVRRDELVLVKAESLINRSYQERESDVGKNVHSLINSRGEHKVVLDNKTYNLATFKFFGKNGGEEKTFTVASRTKERHYLIPDIYLVEIYYAGLFVKADKITLDGRGSSYEGEESMGHAFLVPSF